MQLSLKKAKAEVVKNTIINTALTYAKNNKLNLGNFRNSHPNLYMRIPYYFGNISSFKSILEKHHGVSVTHNYISKKNTDSIPFKTLFLYDCLTTALATMTYQEIADKYGVSRQAVHKIYQELYSLVSNSFSQNNDEILEEN